MSWMKMLYDTYEHALTADTSELKIKLLPIAHSTQNAHIEIYITEEGQFVNAVFVSEDDSQTLIPVTEASASRGNVIAPHALCDKLQYVAKDYDTYVNEKKSYVEYFNKYEEQLSDWCNSPYAHPKAKSVLAYVRKGKVVKDLLEARMLSLDAHMILEKKWSNVPVKLSVGGQASAFVRFRVMGVDTVSAVWEDVSLHESYINYYISRPGEKAFCYISGNIVNCTVNHPSKIRTTGDKAKLISANDTSGFTFRGRFTNSQQACRIGYETSQKAHNALKWLIEKQGIRIGDRVFVLWGTKSEELPSLLDDTFSISMFGEEQDDSLILDMEKEQARQFNNAIGGYKAELTQYSELALIGIDAATVGRMGIVYYREYKGEKQGNDLIDRIKVWHETTSWYHRYKYSDKKRVSFYGAPAPYDIATCAFGTEQGEFIKADSKLVARTVERLLPCISERNRIPRDIVQSIVRKAYQPQNYNNKNNWNKVFSIACAVVRKYYYDYEGEEYTMSVNQESSQLSYNCGRLLAVADQIEYRALEDKQRTTNAMRYFTRFSQFPCDTWRIINDRLATYKQKLGPKGNDLYQLLGEISSLLEPEEFASARALDGRMALGFDSQRQAIINKPKKVSEVEEVE